MGLIAIYIGMIFAELISIYPKEGGVYEYAKQAFGHFPSFILGWMTLIAANVTIAMLVVGAIKYVGPYLPDSWLIGISIAFIVIFNYMAFRGLKTGATMLVAFAIITLTAVTSIMIPGLLSFSTTNFVGWLQPLNESTSLFPISSLIFVTIFFIAETFFGWETSTFLAEKVRNPKKVMPKVMIIATIVIAIVCLLFVVASFSLIPWATFGQSLTPLTDLASLIYGGFISKYYGILVYMAIIGSVAGWIVASPNLILALAKDKLFIPQLSAIHPKTKTPHKAIIFQTIFTSLLVFVGAGNYEKLLHLLVPLVLVLYGSVVLSLIYIRRKKDIERTYVAPLGNWGPVLLIIFILVLILTWIIKYSYALETIGILISFVIIGVPIFVLLFFHYDPQATIKFKNETVILSLFFERMFFPKWIRKKVLQNAHIHGKIVLELGASSGLLSGDIALHGPHEQIIIEQSPALEKIIRKKIKGEHHVKVIIDEHLISRIHEDVKHADEVFSFGILSDLQNEKNYLEQISDLLPENGRIHFFDYVDLYKIIPNKPLLSDVDGLRELFNNAGFAVSIYKYKGIFWNYLVVDGIKTKHTKSSFI